MPGGIGGSYCRQGKSWFRPTRTATPSAERKAVAEADEWIAEFGLTMADWEEMGKGPLPLENAALEPAGRA